MWSARGAGGDQASCLADRGRDVAEPETAMLLSSGGRRAHRALRVAGELVAERRWLPYSRESGSVQRHSLRPSRMG